jgi:hypothetical protein
MTDLRPCCQRDTLDGLTPEEHYPRCDARAEDPQAEVLFGIAPETTEGEPQK